MIYLDWASTTPADPDILAEAARIAVENYGNPSSSHDLGRAAHARLEEARSKVFALLGKGAASGSLAFTGSGTEADGIPLLALLRKAAKDGSSPHVVLTEIEHSAIYEEAAVLRSLGIASTIVRPGTDGRIRPEAVVAALKPETELVCVMAVNNETGAVQPIAEIAKALAESAARLGKRRPRLHVDAVQALGKIAFESAALGVDSAAFSAHKFRGPRGSGALWLARGLEPLVVGGGQEGGLRPGTESLQSAWAFAAAAELAVTRLGERRAMARRFEKRLIEGLSEAGCLPLPLGRKSGDEAYSPFILSVAFPGITGEVLVRALAAGDAAAPGGIAVSTGAACNANAHRKGRRILEAMGLDPALSLSAIRVSTGELTKDEEIEAFISAATALHRRLRA